jgi:hypothetical protein
LPRQQKSRKVISLPKPIVQTEGSVAEKVVEKFGDKNQQLDEFSPLDKGDFIVRHVVKTFSKKFKSWGYIISINN